MKPQSLLLPFTISIRALMCCVAYVYGAFRYNDWCWCTAACLWRYISDTAEFTYEKSIEARRIAKL